MWVLIGIAFKVVTNLNCLFEAIPLSPAVLTFLNKNVFFFFFFFFFCLVGRIILSWQQAVGNRQTKWRNKSLNGKSLNLKN